MRKKKRHVDPKLAEKWFACVVYLDRNLEAFLMLSAPAAAHFGLRTADRR
jgi:hypothetical protein